MLRISTLLLAAVLAFADQPADSQVFQDFLTWYKTYTGGFAPPVVTAAYQARLKETGVAPAEIDRRIAVLRKQISTMPREFAALHFDRIYSLPAPPFKSEASQFLVRMVEGRSAGKALDVAMGQGRNSLYLASRGWDVTGYDISEGGIAAANRAAAQTGLKITTKIDSHEQFDYGVARWDLIVETYAFTNLADAAYRKRVIDSLTPGGLLIIEGFGGPKNVLFDGFKDLRVVCYEDREEVADWGMQKARIQRIAAQKE